MREAHITVKAVTDGEILSEKTYDGKYHFTRERTVLSYDETGDMGSVPTRIDMTGEKTEIRRHGAVRCRMTLQKGKTVPFLYNTPYGVFDMAAKCTEIESELTENGGTLRLRYELFTDNALVSKNELLLNIV